MKIKINSYSIALVPAFLILFLILISSTSSASTIQNSSFTNNYTAIIPVENHSAAFGQFMDLLSVQPVPEIEWQKSLGGPGSDVATSVCQTSDGGYIVAGYSDVIGIDVTENYGSYDYWVVKLDASGNIIWQKSLGGSGSDFAYSVQQTSDGGYLVAGRSSSNDGNVTGNHGSQDYWVVKLDVNGSIVWQKCFGGSSYDGASSIQQISDGGYIVAGYSESKDGNVTGNHGSQDYWVVKLDANGSIVWQKSLGGSSYDGAYSIQQTSDGGYIVAGRSSSNDGNVTENHRIGDDDYWVVKLDATGNIVWQKSLGGSSYDWAYSIQQTFDGGYIVAGTSSSKDGNVTGNHGYEDYWVVKLDANGNIVWQKSLGGSWYDWAYSIQQTFDGSYIVAGYSSSRDGNVTGNGEHNIWVVKLDAGGNIVWQKCFNSGSDGAYSIQQTSDSGYIVAGYNVHNDCSLTKISPDALVSNFSAIPISGLAPLKVGFTDQSVGSPTFWSWDFGDGNNSTEKNPVHIYSAAGNYTVNLTVSNENGNASKSATINVYEKTILPVANFSVNVTEGYAPLSVQFNDSSENTDTVSWNFGDGTNSTEQNPMHTYSVAGNYTVNLTVSNADGADAISKTITVTGKPVRGSPKASFTAKPQAGRAPLTVKFTDKSTNAASIKWNFGDKSAVSTESKLSHTYKSAGIYLVKLTATNGNKSNVAARIVFVTERLTERWRR